MAVGEPTLFLIVLMVIFVVAIGAFVWGFIPDLFSTLPILAVIGVVLVGVLTLQPVARQRETSSGLSASKPHWRDLRESQRRHEHKLSEQRRADWDLTERFQNAGWNLRN